MNIDKVNADVDIHVQVIRDTLSAHHAVITQLENRIVESLERGGKVLLCGNGGSAGDAQHIAGEFINRFRFNRRPLAAIALTTDSSVLTSIGNDFSFDLVYSKQVEALARPGDVAVGITTSGKSKNILLALQAARAIGATTVGFTGTGGGDVMRPYCDLVIPAASNDTPRIQECYFFLWHMICEEVESRLCAAEKNTAKP